MKSYPEIAAVVVLEDDLPVLEVAECADDLLPGLRSLDAGRVGLAEDVLRGQGEGATGATRVLAVVRVGTNKPVASLNLPPFPLITVLNYSGRH